MASIKSSNFRHKKDSSSEVSNEDLMETLLSLGQRFEKKIEFDEYKNQLFDKMHKQLENYQNDAIAASVMPIIMDLILLIDLVRKNQSYISRECSEKDYKKLYALYEGVADDLEAILLRQDIEPYMEDNLKIDIKRQKVNKVYATMDEKRHNTIKESVAPGYEKFGRIVRPEKVDIYKYKGKNK